MLPTRRGALRALGLLIVPAVLPLSACQKSDDTDETLDVDDFVDATASPNPAGAAEASDGRTFRVVRGNNQPDEIIPFKWKTTFALSWTINNNATKDSIDLSFPVQATGTTIVVKQASGGVPNPPTGGDVEHYDSEITNVSANKIGSVGGTISMTINVWYWLPNGGKEALVTVSLAFRDDDAKTFTKNVDVQVQ